MKRITVPCEIGSRITEYCEGYVCEHVVTGFYISSKDIFLLFEEDGYTKMIHEKQAGYHRRRRLWQEKELQNRNSKHGKRWTSALRAWVMRKTRLAELKQK